MNNTTKHTLTYQYKEEFISEKRRKKVLENIRNAKMEVSIRALSDKDAPVAIIAPYRNSFNAEFDVHRNAPSTVAYRWDGDSLLTYRFPARLLFGDEASPYGPIREWHYGDEKISDAYDPELAVIVGSNQKKQEENVLKYLENLVQIGDEIWEKTNAQPGYRVEYSSYLKTVVISVIDLKGVWDYGYFNALGLLQAESYADDLAAMHPDKNGNPAYIQKPRELIDVLMPLAVKYDPIAFRNQKETEWRKSIDESIKALEKWRKNPNSHEVKSLESFANRLKEATRFIGQ